MAEVSRENVCHQPAHFPGLGEVFGKGTVIGMILLPGTTSLGVHWGCVPDSPPITAQAEGPKNHQCPGIMR